MKKTYSQRAGTEVFALSPEQLEVFRKAGYDTPTAAEAIADAGAVKLTPPEGKRAYVAFDFKTGEFFVRVRTCTLKSSEVGGLVGEIVQAAITKRLAESADPDRPKAAPAGQPSTLGASLSGVSAASPIASLFTEAIKNALLGTLTAPPSPATPPAEAASEEVTE